MLTSDDGYLYYSSTGMSVEVTVWYSLDQGETWEEKTETTTDIQECDCGLEVEIDSSSHSSDGIEISGTVTLDSSILNKSDDPCGYSAVISGARIEWLPADPEATPNAVDFEYTDSSISLDDPLSRGVSREFSIWGSSPPSSATGYRLYVDADNASGTMGGKTYTYVGTLTGTATFDFPEPATLSVTVDGGKGTNEGGLLSASGTATIGYDPSTGATGGELQSFFINWYNASGTAYDSDYIDEDAVEWSMTGSSDGQYTFSYSLSGVSAPPDAYGFTVEIYGAVLKGSKQIDWPYGESAKADIPITSVFGNGSFTYNMEQGLFGNIDLTDPAVADDLSGLSFAIFAEDEVIDTVSSNDFFDHEDDSNFVGFTYDDFVPEWPNNYYVQASATYEGRTHYSAKIKVNLPPFVPNLAPTVTIDEDRSGDYDETLYVYGTFTIGYDVTDYSYSATITGAKITWISTDETYSEVIESAYLTMPETVTVAAGGGPLTFDFEIDSYEIDYGADYYQIQFTADVTWFLDGEELNTYEDLTGTSAQITF